MSIHIGGRGPGHLARVQATEAPLVTTSFTFTSALDAAFTASGGANATSVDINGLVVADTAPRFNHTTAGVPLGLLVELARTNICLWSDDLTNAAWTKSNATTAKTATGPDGAANSATTLTATAGNATCLQSITSASNRRVTSCWIKRRTGTGAVQMTQDNGTTWAAVTVTAGWTQVSIASAIATNPIVGLRVVTSGDAVDVALFQHETTTSTTGFATSAIRTTTASVTRTADTISCTGASLSAWYTAARGTVVVTFRPGDVVGNQPVFWFTDTGVGDNLLALSGSTAALVLNVYVAATTPIVAQNVGTIVTDTEHTAGVAFAVNDVAAVLDGGTVATFSDTSGGTPSNIDSLTLGSEDGGSTRFNGHIVSLTHYSKRKTNAELQTLTA